MQETWVRSLGWEDLLEEGMATHSSILAWRIPMQRGAWWAAVHGVAKSQTRLSDSAQNSMTNIGSQVVLVLRNPQANAGDVGDLGSILGPQRSREDTATHLRIPAWRIPWTKEPGGLQVVKNLPAMQDT